MIKLSILRWGGYAGLSGGTNVITSVSRDPVREGVNKEAEGSVAQLRAGKEGSLQKL